MLLLLKRPGGILRGHPFTVALLAHGVVLLLRLEQAGYLQVQLFWIGQVSDLAKRLTSAPGGDDERAVPSSRPSTVRCSVRPVTFSRGMNAAVRMSSPPVSTIR